MTKIALGTWACRSRGERKCNDHIRTTVKNNKGTVLNIKTVQLWHKKF